MNEAYIKVNRFKAGNTHISAQYPEGQIIIRLNSACRNIPAGVHDFTETEKLELDKKLKSILTACYESIEQANCRIEKECKI